VDPYLVLGLRPGSSEREAAAAYRRLAKRWHPDRGEGDERARRMAEINVAYDLLRAAAQREGGASPPPAAARAGARPAGATWRPS
jgi:curved DNA-binding protein CbpA